MTIDLDDADTFIAEDQLEAARKDPAVYARLGDMMADTATPLAERFRALFTLKNLKGPLAVEAICRGLAEKSALLRHELAYVLGQLQDPLALPKLSAILDDEAEDAMVRHEAAEAIGAIGQEESLPILRKYEHTPIVALAETCQIAIDRIRHEAAKRRGEIQEVEPENPYHTVDPAPALTVDLPVDQLQARMMDTSLSLFERYRAIFSLRNLASRGNVDAVHALATGFKDTSALFRHEIAYVFGQVAHPASVPALVEVLTNKDEIPMVRHESAEALGSIATPEVLPILEQFQNDEAAVVKESCVVALDMYNHETSGSFQYADGLEKVTGASSSS